LDLELGDINFRVKLKSSRLSRYFKVIKIVGVFLISLLFLWIFKGHLGGWFFDNRGFMMGLEFGKLVKNTVF
jgi:hypothetical protein